LFEYSTENVVIFDSFGFDQFDESIDELSDDVKSTQSTGSKVASFVDPEKDPQHYIGRYNNEPAYKTWFDKNYPNITIEEAVGLEPVNNLSEGIEEFQIEEIIPNEVIPEAEAIVSPTPIITISEDSPNVAQLVLAVAGLGILFGAVYGVKRKVDTNTKEFIRNKNKLHTSLLDGFRSKDHMKIIKTRLAKGELSIKEYNKLKRTLKQED
jgi:hypothetical protein